MSNVTLKDFRTTAAGLSPADRRAIATQALRLLDGLYVHRDVHPVEYAVAQHRLEELVSRAPGLSERQFHDEMIASFKLLRDRHTHYLLPDVFRGHVAFLPFVLAEYSESGARRYCVTLVEPGTAPGSGIRVGLDVTHWNGVAMDELVRRLADGEDGAHEAARRARALAALTLRPTWLLPLPPEDVVVLTCESDDGIRESSVEWRVTGLPKSGDDLGILNATDVQSRAIQETVGRLFGAPVARSVAAEKAAEAEDVAFLRIANFFIGDDAFVEEFAAFLTARPDAHLAIDIRGNPGGLITAGERSLQLMGAPPIEPTGWQFRASPEALALCRAIGASATIPPAQRDQFLAYLPGITDALKAGGGLSDPIQATTPAQANDRGRIHHGRALLITDALTYSVGDVFAAGFQDHGIGRILGTDSNTGAGGSNDMASELLSRLLPELYPPLPHGASFRVSVRRCLRVRGQAGTPIERQGVASDHLHAPTRDDRLHGDRDLVRQARVLLSA